MIDQAIIDNMIDDLKKSSDHEIAISRAHDLGNFLWKNSLVTFSLKEIELYLTNLIKDTVKLENNNNKSKFLFIASELYISGGHTRLLENLASYLEESTSLLVTRQVSSEVLTREKQFFNSIYTIENKKQNIKKITDIANTILKYKNIILNIHPDDIHSVIACNLAKKFDDNIKVFFVNHADHVFSYGVSTTDLWFEISNYGMQVDKNRELDCHTSFLGIPVTVKDVSFENTYFNNGDIILTAAASYKYKPIDRMSISPLLSLILKNYPDSKCIVIGVNKYRNYWWWPLKLKHPKRLTLSKAMSYDEYINTTSSAKLYIDSHPLIGGTAFVEQYFSGKICTGINGYMSGYSVLENIKKQTPFEVLSYLKKNDYSSLEKLRPELIKLHSHSAVKERFINALNGIETKYSDFMDINLTRPSPIKTAKKLTKYPKKLPIKNFIQFYKLVKNSTFKLKFKLLFIFAKQKCHLINDNPITN